MKFTRYVFPVKQAAVMESMQDEKVTVTLTWAEINLLEAAIRVAKASGDLAAYYRELRSIETALSVATADLFVKAADKAA